MRLRVIRGAHARALALAFSLAALASGCGEAGDGLAREAVSGSVTLDGQPLKSGSINFLPDGPGSPQGGGAPIIDGKYTVAKAMGLVPGKYKVTISSAGGPPPAGEAPGGGAMAKESVPAKYNASSTLTAEVKAGQSTPIDFALESK